ncbi:MAG: AIPR family protein [Clostridia bacterium]|nr:AIPR family protein [Clostridia bacterium]
MDFNEYKQDFLEEVKSTAAFEKEGSCAAFVSLVADSLSDWNVLSDVIPAFYQGIGKNNRKLRVDAYTFVEFDQTLNIIIADYTGVMEDRTLTKSAAMQIFDRAYYFLDEAISGRLDGIVEMSTAAADLVDLIKNYKLKTTRYRIFLFTDGNMSDRITTIDSVSLNGVVVERHIWDLNRLFQSSISEADENIEIDFTEYGNGRGLPYLSASETNSSNYQGYLCIIPGETLADIYDKYGSHLLESNVRSFLSTKVAVNKKIRETILKCPHNFFAFNNGISATATELKVEDRCIVYAKDFQIINGGQTTASLSSARFKDKADLSRIYVQMKITIMKGNDTEFARSISRSSNTQNKVTDADFFSTHPFHIRMEKISRRLFAPATGGAQYETKWYYERAKGQWLQEQMKMTKAEKAHFDMVHPKRQVFSKTDLAKYRNTWDELPHIVSKGAQSNFIKFADTIGKAWNDNDAQYNEKYFKDTVSLLILFKQTEALVSSQPWYELGYRANIVTYSIALLHRLIKQQFPGKDLDLSIIWDTQTVPEAVKNELIGITKYVLDSITAEDRLVLNVTQWCKRDDCWKRMQTCDLILSNGITKYLISETDRKEAEKDAKKDQKFVSEIEAMSQVIAIPAQTWEAIYRFAIDRRIGNPKMLEAVLVAASYPKKYPNGKKSLLCLELKDLVEAEGFKA